MAAAQLGGIQPGETRAGVAERLLALFGRAAAAECRLVVFPELTLTTFFPRYFLADPDELDRFFEPTMPGPETRPLFDAARRLGVGFHLGYAERAREAGRVRRFNTAILADPSGEIVGKYRKVHLPGHSKRLAGVPFQHLEKRYFEVGDLGFPVWRAFGGIVGMCICNDRRWPETWRVLGLRGVEMILLGYNTPETNIHHREPAHLRMFHHRLSIQAGAYQNATWVVAAAKCGVEDGQRLIGGSAIVSPNGEIVAEAAGEGDELVIADCDLDLGADLKRHVFDFARHRRIEHYRLISERTAALPPPRSGRERGASAEPPDEARERPEQREVEERRQDQR